MLKKLHHPDYVLLIILVILSAFGTLILASVSAPLSYDIYGVTDFYLKHQMIFGLIPGLVLGLIAYFVNLEWIRKNSFYPFIAILFLMAAVFLPVIGHSSGGASRWLKLGTYTFQPAEFLKLLFIIYLSGILANIKEKYISKNKKDNDKKTLIVFLAIVSLAGLLLLAQKDLSTLLVVTAVAAAIYFYSGAPIKYLLFFAMGAIILLSILVFIEPYRMSRIFTLFTDVDITDEGYQVNQALISIGSGGLGGVGLGMSYQRFGFVPAAISDAIFPILAEETGLIGSITLICLFLAFSLRGFRIIRTTPEYFSQYLALGITIWIVFQGLINIASMVKIMPILGIPLPFVSYGGSALINEMIAVGLLLNISKKSINT
ncbi:MAG: FtsW/RodA/SpoVE family cell cycle protein [bacterium]